MSLTVVGVLPGAFPFARNVPISSVLLLGSARQEYIGDGRERARRWV